MKLPSGFVTTHTARGFDTATLARGAARDRGSVDVHIAAGSETLYSLYQHNITIPPMLLFNIANHVTKNRTNENAVLQK